MLYFIHSTFGWLLGCFPFLVVLRQVVANHGPQANLAFACSLKYNLLELSRTFDHILSVAASVLHEQSWIVVIETVWLTKAKIFIMWLLIETGDCCSKYILLCICTNVFCHRQCLNVPPFQPYQCRVFDKDLVWFLKKIIFGICWAFLL